MDQWARGLALQVEDLSLNLQNPHKKPVMATCIFNSSIGRQRHADPRSSLARQNYEFSERACHREKIEQ